MRFLSVHMFIWKNSQIYPNVTHFRKGGTRQAFQGLETGPLGSFLQPMCDGHLQARNRGARFCMLCAPTSSGLALVEKFLLALRGCRHENGPFWCSLFCSFLLPQPVYIFYSFLPIYNRLFLLCKHFEENEYLIPCIKLIISLTICIPYLIFPLLNKHSLSAVTC